MHAEAAEKRKDFIAAWASLRAELMKIMGVGIAETITADQADGTTASVPCADCITWLERKYGTLSSAHVQKLIADLQV